MSWSNIVVGICTLLLFGIAIWAIGAFTTTVTKAFIGTHEDDFAKCYYVSTAHGEAISCLKK